MFVKQGHDYILGAHVPEFFGVPVVSKGILISEGQKRGFAQIQIVERDQFPISQVPMLAPGTNNDWNRVATGRRVEPDGNVDLPSEVRWVVDVTPVAVAPPPPQPEPPPLTVNAGFPDFFPFLQPVKPLHDESGPAAVAVPSGLGLPLVVGMGVIGGVFFGYQALSHMFGEGLTDKERKNILMYTASILAVWGASQLIDVDKAWWLTPEGAGKKAFVP